MMNLNRIGDETDHGGKVETGSSTMRFDGCFVARKGDRVSCPQHPEVSPNFIEEDDAPMTDDGIPIARHGHQATCGLSAHFLSYLKEPRSWGDLVRDARAQDRHLATAARPARVGWPDVATLARSHLRRGLRRRPGRPYRSLGRVSSTTRAALRDQESCLLRFRHQLAMKPDRRNRRVDDGMRDVPSHSSTVHLSRTRQTPIVQPLRCE
ncbi:PAAR repeat-containing protein [Burkholderia cepacia]|uniref:PAAR repeat-containing protein n=1 Tax=Burkholderia cepacia TaxID=292 RepID=A0AAE8NLP1_BURCE|nr:hypothetical protein CSX04_07347 [Burkholderia cepacia]SQA60662.1 PAAR repeat-containing protein [Burkholderia cepacia]